MFRVPGLFVLCGEPFSLGYQMYYRSGEDIYWHLSCYSEEGYSVSISYKMIYHAINLFKKAGFRYLHLGAGAGINNSSPGLEEFKKGWSNLTKPNYIVKEIVDRNLYFKLSEGKSDAFFPRYRGT